MADLRQAPAWARWTAGGCAVAVVAASAYLVFAPTVASATDGLRTATVSTASVTQTVALSGGVQRVDQVDTGFRTSGTVTAVRVGVGDTVTAGQVVATIDDAALGRAVTVAQANLVAAQAALDAGTTGSTGSTGTGSPTTSGSSRASTSSATSGTTSGSQPGGSGARPGAGSVDTGPLSAVTAASSRLLDAATAACAPLLGPTGTPPAPGPSPTPTTPPSPSPTASPSPSATGTPTTTTTPTSTSTPTSTPSPSPTTSPTPTASPTSSGTPTPTPSGSPSPAPSPSPTSTPAPSTPTAQEVSDCVAALGAALSSTGHATSTLSRLSGLLDATATALQQQQSTAATRGTTAAGTTTAGTTPAPSSTASGGGGGAAGGGGSTAALEVQVLTATQRLASAQQDLSGATLRAPIAGTVARLDLVTGQQAAVGSGLVVVGPGAAVVTVDVPLAQLGQVRVDQPVAVVPAGTSTTVDGLVATIGVLPASTTSSTPSYPVTVTVSDAPVTLATGSTATASITLATVSDVLTVPVSAIAGLSSGLGEVEVASGGTTSTVRIEVGAVGEGRAQVASGLTLGQRVVLADPSQPLPSASTGLRGGFGGGGGGFGGGPPRG